MSQNANSNISTSELRINARDYSGRIVESTQETVSFREDMNLRIWYNDTDQQYSPHWHNALEIVVSVKNDYDVCINETDYHLAPQEILIIPPGELHSMTAPGPGTRYIFLFDLSCLDGFKSFYEIRSLLISPIYITPEKYPGIHEEIYALLLQMKDEYFAESNLGELSIYSLLLKIFVKLGNHRLDMETAFPNVRSYKKKEYIQKFNTLLDYINTHYAEDLNLDAVAAMAGFSKYHFVRLFKQYTGYTFCDYITYRRIKVAEEMLDNSTCSITEVALQAGFPSISTFNRIFKQHKNCSPSEFRAHKILEKEEKEPS